MIHAAILTVKHSFRVQTYERGAPLGTLSVFGTIGQLYRGAVGTFSGSSPSTGYSKDYTYDQKLRYTSPPHFLDPVASAWGVQLQLESADDPALAAFIREAQRPVSGEVRLGLYKGNVDIQGRDSPNSLYDAAIASMEAGGSYDQTDAEGFLRIAGLPSRVQAKLRPRKY